MGAYREPLLTSVQDGVRISYTEQIQARRGSTFVTFEVLCWCRLCRHIFRVVRVFRGSTPLIE